MEFKTIAIVPAFNESKNIGGVIEDLRTHYPTAKILVINDCSIDHCDAVVRLFGESVISLPINLGIGGAVQTGLKYALDNGYDIAFQFDGDGQHMASEVEKIVLPIIRREADVVIGSRFLGTNGYQSSLIRRFGIEIFRLVNSLLIRRKITDNTSGFRAYNRRAIEFLSLFYPQDYPEPEAVIELFRNGFQIIEVPTLMRERKQGHSSIRTFGSGYYMIKVLMASLIAFSRKPVYKEKN